MRVNEKTAGLNTTLDDVKCARCGEHWAAGTPVLSGGHDLRPV